MEGGGRVCLDELGPLAFGYNLTAYHVWTLELYRLQASALLYLSYGQTHSLMRAPGTCGRRRLTHHILSKLVVTICFVRDLGFCQHYQIAIAKLDLPNSLGKAKSPGVTDVVCP